MASKKQDIEVSRDAGWDAMTRRPVQPFRAGHLRGNPFRHRTAEWRAIREPAGLVYKSTMRRNP